MDVVHRAEWLALGLIVVLAILLRAAVPARMAVEHFDEGVYASNLYSAGQQPPFVYPDRHLYAPPLLPGLLEWAMLLTGRPESVMWVNVCIGALTVAVLWWGVRGWFGPAAGIGAALLAATSDYHIAFSRMALTDASLGLFLAAGVFAGWRAVTSGRPVWIVAAGLLAALAWWTKYNGWLTLAITGAGTAAWLLFCRERPVSATSAVLRWGGTAAIAVVSWLPFLSTLPEGSSYAEIRANHARYFLGLSGWCSSAARHGEALRYLDGWIAWGGVLLAIMGCVFADRNRFTWNPNRGARSEYPARRTLAVSLFAAVALIAAGSSIALGLCGTACVAILGIRAVEGLRQPSRVTTDQPALNASSSLGWWMAAAWFTGLLVATPLYHPYPRLALPWVMSCWVLGSAMIARVVDWCAATALPRESGRSKRTRAAVVTLLFGAVAAAAVWLGPPWFPPRGTAWQDRGGMRRIARSILADAKATVATLGPSGRADVDAVFYVYAEPALFFQLEAAAPHADLHFVSSPATSLELRDPVEVAVFLVTGPHAHREGSERHPAVQEYSLVARYDYRPSDLVRLDEVPAADLARSGGRPEESVRLYVVHGPLPSP